MRVVVNRHHQRMNSMTTRRHFRCVKPISIVVLAGFIIPCFIIHWLTIVTAQSHVVFDRIRIERSGEKVVLQVGSQTRSSTPTILYVRPVFTGGEISPDSIDWIKSST